MCIPSFTVEAEFIACYEVSNHGILLWNFITGMCDVDGIKRLLKIYCDNKVTMLYSYNNISSLKLKHIDIKFLVVKGRVQSQQVSIEHISTNSMVADPFTKSLPPKLFHVYFVHMDVLLFDDMHE